ncbi:MAG: GNAT family N-acetyltransferase [Roseiarcus sp.]
MFPDIARDDVFRLETARLWLRWPRAADAPAIHRYSSRWEVARYTARIPHPYPPGSAHRFVYAARDANANGRDLVLVIEPRAGRRDVVGAVSLEAHSADRLMLGYALSPDVWGRGFATEAVAAIVEAGFSLSRSVEIYADVRVENPPSRRVLEKNGFDHVSTGPQGAPARGGLVACDRMRLLREAWIARRAAAREASAEALR